MEGKQILAEPKPIAEASKRIPGLRVIRNSPPAESFLLEADPYFGLDEPQAIDSEIVEGNRLAAHSVSDIGKSDFTHFVDGAQTSRLAYEVYGVCGYLSFINAAVLCREGKEILNEHCDYEELLAIFHVDENSEAKEIFEEIGWKVIPVVYDVNKGLAGLRELVLDKISETRYEMETKLAKRWMESSEGWLYIDGGVAKLCTSLSSFCPIVGVVKSHRKQYFKTRDAREVILNLKVGERSSVFIARTGQQRDEAYSWYLRLYDDSGSSASYGLVRIEMPPFEETMRWVDSVSAWLIAETTPLSLPDPRYDRLIYPIRRVEVYLKSHQPSATRLQGWIGY
ncbi:MAG TPA: hypothetical protein VNK96_05710 [Fimbriimonadales bacterium]|nr:hypothetical protein [Fimbriimonadales bacterium]